ncbi:MAG: hypothetical protein ACLP1X_31640 [Polyangiaceae bacterium]
MNRHIVVAFRMPPAGMIPGADGAYLNRARSLCARGEALGGRLVAWSAVMLAIAWDADSIEEALLLATSVREGAQVPERGWAGGVAEGELEPLAPDGQRMHLAWGEALLSSVSLARVARPGEVLVDGDVRALRAGQLTLRGARSATDSGQRIRGWRLDLEAPWKTGAPVSGSRPPAEFSADGLSTEEVLEIVERASQPPPGSGDDVASGPPPAGTVLAERVRALVGQEPSGRAVETLADLRRSRARAEGGPPTARCQAALALSMTLCIAGRTEEALLEGLDALARSREAQDPRAIGACLALLSKLYANAGFADAAAALKI